MKKKKITIKTAEAVAQTMATEVFEKRRTTIEEKLMAIADELVMQKAGIPALVLQAFEKHASYFNTTTQVCVRSATGAETYIHGSKQRPYPQTGGYGARRVDVEQSEYERVIKLKDELRELDKLENKTYHQLKDTLLALKTYDRIKEEFPEAAEHLPEVSETITTVALPIQDLRNLINEYTK